MMTNQTFNRRLFLQGAGLAAGLAFSGIAWGQLQVDILGVGASQFPIAVQPFENGGSAPEDISKIISDDLVRSGLFRMTGASSFAVALNSTPDWKSLASAGADADVVGEVVKTGDNRYEVKFKLYDVVKQQETDQASYVVPADDLRLAAHHIADRIYERITGEKGDFATRIAFVRQDGRKRFDIMVADSDGHNPRAAFKSRDPIMSIAWSPDGHQIAYTTFETGKPTVWIQNLSTGKRRQVAAFKGNNSAPAFSPDGRTMAVALSKDGGTKIFLMNTDGTNLRPFTTGSSIDTEPTFSPDGKYIYFTSDRGGNPQIYRKSLDSGNVDRVSFGNAYSVSPTVSPKNNEIAYIVRTGGNFQLVQQDLATGNVTPLSQLGKNESPSYSPNGNMIIFATDEGGRGVLSTVSTDGSSKSRLGGLSGDIREPAWGPTIR